MKATYKLIYNRTNKLNSKGQALIQIRVTLNRKPRYFKTGIYVKPGEWSAKDGGMVIKHPNAIKYNIIIRDLRTRIEDEELDCIAQGRKFDLSAYDPEGGGSTDSLFLFMRHELNEESLTIATTTYDMLYSFINTVEQCGIFTTIQSATLANIERYNIHLHRTYPSAQTIHQKHAKLRKYLNVAVRRGLLSVNPYDNFRLSKPKDPKRKYLTIEEVITMRSRELIPRLATIRDMFLISCFTGLAYADINKLTSADIYVDNGTMFIVTDRAKTSEESSIPLLPQAAEIITQYANKGTGKLLPIPSNQKFNAYLKEIQTLCGITTNLTHHVARHTFATTITLSNGVPMETVSRMLGHANIKTTQIYAKMTRHRLSDDMQQLSEKLK